MTTFATSMTTYEQQLRARFGADVDAAALALKHEKMADSPFLFLRATCWRWAKCANALVPDAFAAPEVGSIGDAHAGNFGLWRDAQARLVWGVNDFDEAARLPYPLDLIRLAASLLLADAGTAGDVAHQVLNGYTCGLHSPKPFILENENLWLRDAFAADDDDRQDFWAKLATAPVEPAPSPYLEAVRQAAPPDAQLATRRRPAGAGSLGRPRFAAYGSYRGGPLAYEAKGQLPSCWTGGRVVGLAARLAGAATRSPNPSLTYQADLVVRRLGPDSRKLKFAKIGAKIGAELIAVMAADIAAVHVGGDTSRDLASHLASLPDGWLKHAARRVADWTTGEYELFARG